MSEEVLLTELCSGLWCITSTTGLAVCIDGNTLDQLPEDGNLTQLTVIAIDSPTMDSPTSTASTSTSSSAPVTSTSPDDVILTCNSSLIDEPYDSYCAHLPQLFVPTAMRSMTQQEEVLLTELCSGLWCITSTTGLAVCIDGNTLDQLPEDGNLTQLRVIAIDSPTMDSPTSTASTSTSSSAPITSTSPDDVILTCNSSLIHGPTIHIVPTFLSCLFLQPCGQWQSRKQWWRQLRSGSPAPRLHRRLLPWCVHLLGECPLMSSLLRATSPVSFPHFPTGAADFSCQGRQNQVTIFNKHITTMHIWSVFARCRIIHYYTLHYGLIILAMVYSMAPSGPFNVACTIIIQTIYLATTVYLAPHSII